MTEWILGSFASTVQFIALRLSVLPPRLSTLMERS